MCVTNTISRRPKTIVLNNRLGPAASNQEAARPSSDVQNRSNQFSEVFSGIASTYQSSRSRDACSAASSSSSSASYWSDHSVAPSVSEEKKPTTAPKKRRRKPQKPGKTAKMNDRHFVVHNYHDHSHEQPDASDLEQASKRRRGGGTSMSFPLKLHAMLDQIEADGLGHVISWQPHGRAFLVHKPDEFVSHVMPTYFRQTKLTSFQRQLNLYGFCRLSRGADNRGYYHELFLRGKPFLCHRMVRTKVKGTKFKAASSPEAEPDFYRMPSVSASGVPVVTPPASSSEDEQSSGDSDYSVQEQAACNESTTSSAMMMQSPVASFDTDFVMTAPMSPIASMPTTASPPVVAAYPSVPSLEYTPSPQEQELFSDELFAALGMDECQVDHAQEDDDFEQSLENDYQLGCLLQQFLTAE